MQVSVIIPNFNHAAYLEKRIDSVLSQTYQNFEVIILDDCSTDNSTEIINQYINHPKVAHIVFNKENSGSTFKQWEKGVALAKAEYIWIAESDDYADENFLDNAMQRFNSNKELGLFFSDYYSIDANSSVIKSNNIYPAAFVKYFSEHAAMDGKYFCEHYLFFSCLILNASAVVFKKHFFIAADKTYMNLKIAGDWRMWVNICYNTQIFFDKKKMNFFRMHANNVRTRNASLLGSEVIYNHLYFLKKTANKQIKERLKESICKMWVYNVMVHKNFRLNLILLNKIVLADAYFPLRLAKRLLSKLKKQKPRLKETF